MIKLDNRMIKKYDLSYDGETIVVYVEGTHEKLFDLISKEIGNDLCVEEILLDYISYMVKESQHDISFVKDILQNRIGYILTNYITGDMDNFFESDMYSAAQQTIDAQMEDNYEWSYKRIHGNYKAPLPFALWPLKGAFESDSTNTK